MTDSVCNPAMNFSQRKQDEMELLICSSKQINEQYQLNNALNNLVNLKSKEL